MRSLERAVWKRESGVGMNFSVAEILRPEEYIVACRAGVRNPPEGQAEACTTTDSGNRLSASGFFPGENILAQAFDEVGIIGGEVGGFGGVGSQVEELGFAFVGAFAVVVPGE